MTAVSQIFLSPVQIFAAGGGGTGGAPPSGSTTRRGYGHAHQKLRAKLKLLVDAGGVRCWRCGKLIHPSERWDLGHDDRDRRRYKGPEHLKCNRATATRRRRWHSRKW
ncbi:MAG TPA: hypothetical protein VFN92_13390 [Solirubrobacterales bacterium]|nr:hypothetical protein [Solirubrobacterales bacterium]